MSFQAGFEFESLQVRTTYQKTAVTEARMFFGALVKAYSKPTTLVKISEKATKM
jgi:hypothetical protein